MEDLNFWLLFPFFAVMAFLYGSAGHGGASGYLALFAIAGVTDPAIAPMVLTMNVIVSGIGFQNFYRFGYFRFSLLWPFVITSIPAAFLGARVDLSVEAFELALGVVLLLSALFMGISGMRERWSKIDLSNINVLWLGLPAGFLIGLVSGTVGIGGGVFLTPLLIITAIASVKHTAATASAFIFLNSLSGLSGHILRDNIMWEWLLPFVITVGVGGYIGSYLSAGSFTTTIVRALTIIVLLIAGFKLVFT